ncbi:hypothetical protein BDV59DRAFT_174720 [Aspergillus ambiguus]|uniref:FAD-dependent oxidoreductase n=1 Tax=Aspergillus ambiguus TaxID=176160 RepID=UPI003CCD45E4
MDRPKFKVIIVGGSIAGLTLAHCLSRANIDHVVLEKGEDIAPQLGASIGIFPNGGRILQQLGLFDELEALIEPIRVNSTTFPDGFMCRSYMSQQLEERFGFPIAFLDRQKLLDILYRNYPHRTNVITNTKVTELRRLEKGICAVTDNGTLYHGDVIVGADGVHSRVRSELWRFAGTGSQKIITEKANMTVEYACIFGISSGVSGVEPGEMVQALRDGLTVLALCGKNNRVFWFIIRKLDKKYVYPDSPRFSSEDAEQACAQVADVHVYKDLYVRDLWKAREVASMTALEEFLLETWHHDSIVLLGDSVHKMAPNFGQGANCAIEDAAILSSLLHELVKASGVDSPTDQQIESVLGEYREQRYDRASRICNMSSLTTRVHARDGFIKTILGRYYTPYAEKPSVHVMSKFFADAPALRFLLLPERSGPGWVIYKREALWTASVRELIKSAFEAVLGWWLSLYRTIPKTR